MDALQMGRLGNTHCKLIDLNSGLFEEVSELLREDVVVHHPSGPQELWLCSSEPDPCRPMVATVSLVPSCLRSRSRLTTTENGSCWTNRSRFQRTRR